MSYSLGSIVARPVPVSAVGAIASLSSERNAVNKSSALTMNWIEADCEDSAALMVSD